MDAEQDVRQYCLRCREMNRLKRVVVITQEDSFVIPKNIARLGKLSTIELVAVVKVDAKGSLVNKKDLFFKGFGAFQVGKMGVLLTTHRLINLIDAVFLYKLQLLKSLKSSAAVCGSMYKEMNDPNDIRSIAWLADLDIDLIISFSAPCVFREELLKTPVLGCINLHCSLLPQYAGLLPSFWALYKKAEKIGVTVHKMDDKIDNGAILGQLEIPVPESPSMYKVINATKHAGGGLMISVVGDILEGRLRERPNEIGPDDYHSWPTVQEIQRFCDRGGRLI